MKRIIFLAIVFLLLVPVVYSATKCPKTAPCLIDKRTFSIYVTYDKDIATLNKVVFYNNATKQQLTISSSQINSTTFKFGPVTVPQFDLYILNTTVTSTDGVISNESSYFLVKLLPLKISLVEPPFGVSSKILINFTVKTDRHSDCRHDTDERRTFAEMRYTFSGTYTNGDAQYFVAANYRLSAGAPIPVFVMCSDDEFANYANKTFLLSYDATEPNILEAEARPSLVTEKYAGRLYETTFVVSTDDETVCRYDISSKTYDRLLSMFQGEDETQEASYNRTHHTVIGVAQEGHYAYYVACRNLAGLFSDIERISFIVNASLPLQITYISPEEDSIISATKSPLTVITNKESICTYGNGSTSGASGTFATLGTRHVSSNLTLKQGANTYFFKCDFQGQTGYESAEASVTFTVDTTPPSKPQVNISAAENSSQTRTYLRDRFNAVWSSADIESGIVQYRYRLMDSNGTILSDWVPYLSGDASVSKTISDFSLEPQKSYRLAVSALNGAGFWSINGTSNLIYVDVDVSAVCRNGQLDPDYETDVDCGFRCPKCGNNSKCKANSDCTSNYCSNATSKCQKPTCYDKIRNGDETSVDCGGSCPSCWGDGDTDCFKDSDCPSNYECTAGLCKEIKCENMVKDSSESDVDCGILCPPCSMGKHCNEDADCEQDLTCENDVCTGTAPSPTECTDDTDCSTGYECIDDFCEPKETPQPEGCIDDSDCSTDYVCEDGKCVEKSKGGFSFWTFLLWAFIILLLAAGIFIGLSAMRKKPMPKQASPFPPAGAEFGPMQPRPMKPVARQAPPSLVQKRRQQFKDEHKKVFDEFGEAGEETTPEAKAEIKPLSKAEEKPITVPQAPKEKEKTEEKAPESAKEEEKPSESSFRDIHEELVQKLEKMSKTKYKKAKPAKITKKKK